MYTGNSDYNWGQFIIQYIEQQVNKYMNDILQTKDKVDYIVTSDADSIYLCLDKLVEESM